VAKSEKKRILSPHKKRRTVKIIFIKCWEILVSFKNGDNLEKSANSQRPFFLDSLNY